MCIRDRYRGREIGHIQPLAQRVRDAHPGEVDDHIGALLPSVDARIRIAKVNRDPRLAILSPPEPDVTDAVQTCLLYTSRCV